jgi:hypothetical protein
MTTRQELRLGAKGAEVEKVLEDAVQLARSRGWHVHRICSTVRRICIVKKKPSTQDAAVRQ